MPGPKNEADARRWVRRALENGCFIPAVHFKDQCRDREVFFADADQALRRCRFIEPYPEPPRRGGTCWRLFGSNVDQTKEIGIGIEAYVSDAGVEMIILCTVLPPREKR